MAGSSFSFPGLFHTNLVRLLLIFLSIPAVGCQGEIVYHSIIILGNLRSEVKSLNAALVSAQMSVLYYTSSPQSPTVTGPPARGACPTPLRCDYCSIVNTLYGYNCYSFKIFPRF